MYSFEDLQGNVIPFETRQELSLDLQTDIVTGNVTAYLVICNGYTYQVTKKTYEAIEHMAKY